MNKHLNNIFQLNCELPEMRGNLPIYRTSTGREGGGREKNWNAAFEKRVIVLADYFDLPQKPEDQGDRSVYMDRGQALEVFCASDSMWWVNRKLAFSENPEIESQLPEKDKARMYADSIIDKLGLGADNPIFHSITYNYVSVQHEGQNEVQEHKTGLNINYGYELSSLPVLGPGAKLQLTLTGSDELAQILSFWRHPSESGMLTQVHPLVALERFTADARFAQLRPESSIKIEEVKIGYYAMEPSEVQRNLMPVYAIKGVEIMPEGEELDFTNYCMAVEASVRKEDGSELGRFVLAQPRGVLNLG